MSQPEDKREQHFKLAELNIFNKIYDLKTAKGEFVFKETSTNTQLEKGGFYGLFIYDPQKTCYVDDFEDIDEKATGSNPEEKFKNLSEKMQKYILRDHEIFCYTLKYFNPWRFMSYDLSIIQLTIPLLPNYTPEELRLSFYLSYENSNLMPIYKKYMDKYEDEFNANSEKFISMEFSELISENQTEWLRNSKRLDLILSKYFNGFNTNEPLIIKIQKNIIELSDSDHDKNYNEKNPWYTVSSFEYPHECLFESINPSNVKKFENSPHSFTESYPMIGDLFTSNIGPEYFQKNSQTKNFDGAYSHNEYISETEILLFSMDEFQPGTTPLFPPTRELVRKLYKSEK